MAKKKPPLQLAGGISNSDLCIPIADKPPLRLIRLQSLNVSSVTGGWFYGEGRCPDVATKQESKPLWDGSVQGLKEHELPTQIAWTLRHLVSSRRDMPERIAAPSFPGHLECSRLIAGVASVESLNWNWSVFPRSRTVPVLPRT